MSLQGFQGATKDFHIDKRFTALELIGGRDCYPDNKSRRPDLSVRGGLLVEKNACLTGDLTLISGEATIEGNLTVLQNSFLGNTYVTKLTADDICTDRLIADCIDADSIQARNLTGNVPALSVDKITVNDCIDVKGNLMADGVMFSNVVVKGNLDIAGDENVAGDLCIDGNLKIEMLMIEADLTVGNAIINKLTVEDLMCGDLQVDMLNANILKANLLIIDDLQVDKVTANMFCANVLMVDDFSVKGNISVENSLEIQGDSNVDGDLCISGNLKISMLMLEADLTVGNAAVENLDVENITADMMMSNVFMVKGDFELVGNLNVENITAEMMMSNVFMVKEDFEVFGSEVVQGDLIIQGNSNISANIDSEALAEALGNVLTVSGINLSGDLLDAFGRQRVSDPFTISDNKFLTNTQLEFWDQFTDMGATIDFTPGYLTFTCSSAGDKAVRQTRRYMPYQPGKGLNIMVTGTLEVTANTNVVTRIGYFDDADDKNPIIDTEASGNGYFFEWDGNVVNIVERTFITGVQTETRIPQSSWNVDTFDGTGPSGFTLDVTKRQNFVIDLAWLGVSSVSLGFNIRRKPLFAHMFFHSNVDDSRPFITRPTLPVRYEAESFGGVATLRQICSTVISDGGYSPKGAIYSRSMGAGTSTSIASVHTPLIAIRLKAMSKRVTLNLLKTTILSTSGNDFYVALWRFLSPATDPFGGTATFISANPNSAAEYAENSGETMTLSTTGGILLDENYVSNRADSGTFDLADRLGAIVTSNISGVSDILVIAGGPDMGVQAAAAMQWQELE